jgi:hypothetical protein
MSAYITNKRSVSVDCMLDNVLDDLCNECDHNIIFHECNKCGSGVCNSIECHSSFPHYRNTQFVVCNGCYKNIDYKLLNYDHLLIYNFLKKNMRKRRISC